ncbi:MAG TPA: transglycosylase family protein [Solirubrobacterales bacterium]|nr:transglycosylase family protein [Solirubrobacterales bacterium]
MALAVPAVAFAAPDGQAPTRIGLADAVPAEAPAWMKSGHSLRTEMRQAARRIRAARRARIEREREEAFASLPGGVSQSTLDAIASCESGGNPTAVSSDGSYRGKYQFSFETWASVGGSGDPAAAPEEEQDYRAALLYAQSGSSPWPICG